MTEPTPPRGPVICCSCRKRIETGNPRRQCFCGAVGHPGCLQPSTVDHPASDHARRAA